MPIDAPIGPVMPSHPGTLVDDESGLELREEGSRTWVKACSSSPVSERSWGAIERLHQWLPGVDREGPMCPQ